MNIRFLFTIIVICFVATHAYAGDTLRFELLKLEKIEVDTLKIIESDKFLGCYTLTFQQGQNKKTRVSYINIGSLKSKAIVYPLEKGSSAKSFGFGIGLYYRLFLERVCHPDIETDNYYSKNADFGADNCSLTAVFSASKYTPGFSITKTHYLHIEASVFKVLWFAPTQVSNAVGAKANIGFLPVNIKYNK